MRKLGSNRLLLEACYLLGAMSLLCSCSSKSNLREIVDAKGVYHTPSTYEYKSLQKNLATNIIGQQLTQTTIKKKIIKSMGSIYDAQLGKHEQTNIEINLRAQVILFEKEGDAISGACYSKTDISLPNSMLQKVSLYGRKLSGLSQLRKDTTILQFQSSIPTQFNSGLEKALNWCWKYVYYLNEKELISSYSAIYASLAYNIPSSTCIPYPEKSYNSSSTCREWYSSLPKEYTQGTIPICTSMEFSSSVGRCELRGTKNSYCPYIATNRNERALNASAINDLAEFTKGNLSGQRMFLCPEGNSVCKQTNTYKFSKYGKKITETYVCR